MRELDSVADEVREKLKDTVDIGEHGHRRRGQRHRKGDLSRLGKRAKGVDAARHDACDVLGGWLHREPARLEPRDVEKILNERVDLLGGLPDDRDALQYTGARLRGLTLENAAREHLHRVRWISEIVRHNAH